MKTKFKYYLPIEITLLNRLYLWNNPILSGIRIYAVEIEGRREGRIEIDGADKRARNKQRISRSIDEARCTLPLRYHYRSVFTYVLNYL